MSDSIVIARRKKKIHILGGTVERRRDDVTRRRGGGRGREKSTSMATLRGTTRTGREAEQIKEEQKKYIHFLFG